MPWLIFAPVALISGLIFGLADRLLFSLVVRPALWQLERFGWISNLDDFDEQYRQRHPDCTVREAFAARKKREHAVLLVPGAMRTGLIAWWAWSARGSGYLWVIPLLLLVLSLRLFYAHLQVGWNLKRYLSEAQEDTSHAP
jgi:hypothetical protein